MSDMIKQITVVFCWSAYLAFYSAYLPAGNMPFLRAKSAESTPPWPHAMRDDVMHAVEAVDRCGRGTMVEVLCQRRTEALYPEVPMAC